MTTYPQTFTTVLPELFVNDCSIETEKLYAAAQENGDPNKCLKYLENSGLDSTDPKNYFHQGPVCKLENGEEFSYDQCIREVAQVTQDIKVCDFQGGWSCFKQISNIDYKDCLESAGKSNCIRTIAGREKNLTMCDLLNEGTIKDLCFGDVAIALNDETMCVHGSNLLIDRCYDGIARNLNDVKICEKIFDSYIKQSCKVDLTN